MESKMPTFPFEAPSAEIQKDAERYVDAVFACLESEFLVLPKGAGFVEYPVFELGYEAIKAATNGFTEMTPERVFPVTVSEPISIVVLRSMLGLTPPEWGYVTTQETGTSVTQGFIRSLDRKVRMAPKTPLNPNGVTKERLRALVETACRLLCTAVPGVEKDQLHRLDKADTKRGVESIRNLAGMGVP